MWASPVVLAKKKEGSFCLCVDYSRLNEASISDARVLTFDLKNSPDTFVRLMGEVLKGFIGAFVEYLDDIVIYSYDETEHLVHIE